MVHRVPIQVNANPLVLAFVSAVAAIPGALLAVVLRLPIWGVILFTVGGVNLVFVYRYFAGVKRIVKRAERADADAPLETWLPEAVNNQVSAEMLVLGLVNRRWRAMQKLAEQVCQRHGVGGLVEMHPPSYQVEDPPLLEVPIEPTPLRPGVRVFASEPIPQEAVGERVRKAIEMTTSFYGDSTRMRYIVTGLMLFGFAALGFAFYQGLQQLLRGSVPDLVWQLGLGVVVGLMVSIPRMLYPQQWLLVNGGVVVRHSSWRASRWDLTRFTPGDGIVLYWRNLNLVSVYRQDGAYFSRPITTDEFALLHQAWCSPLEPPPVTQLSDWE